MKQNLDLNRRIKAIINLFNAVPINKRRKGRKDNAKWLKSTINKGFIFSPEVIEDYSERGLLRLIEFIGITSEQINNSFHKSWEKIKKASIEQLVLEQICHYITTYGFEELGIYDKDSVYIPQEKLEIPDINIKNIKLTLIKGYTKEEIKEKLLDLLNSGIAFGAETMAKIVDVALFVDVNNKEIELIKNKEVKIMLYCYLGKFPENPIEFLRYVVYRATGKTLLIKNKETIETIKTGGNNLEILSLFDQYKDKYGLERLAEIFNRFKPLFLAFKTNYKLNSTINKIRKLSKKYHKPMKEDYLNNITALIKRNEIIEKEKLEYELNKVNIFRKIRLAYALKFRTKEVNSIIYRIRNGNAYATDFNFDNKEKAETILNIVLESIAKDISKNVKDKTIYLPNYVQYTLPATEKQFIGNFPSGTYISISKDMIMGIHWENDGNNRVDLDLSMINLNVKIGWDSLYRTEDNSILFSGDIVDAQLPNGASELLYIKKQEKSANIVFLNFFNAYDFNKEQNIPFKIIIAKELVKDFNRNYTVNPNNIVTIVNSNINKKQKILGLLITTHNENRFYFAETYIGNTRTAGNPKFVSDSRKYLFDFYTDTILLRKILLQAGAKIVKNKEKCDIDLSPENLEKDTILKLLK